MTEHSAGDESPSSPAETTYAFLNHSSNTLVNKLPPDVDNKPLARQKRKRTSPEDQAVLEAAYLRDPKPDKEARLRLLEQIALGEKEVQIWFQNRRQTSRRKSRPLLPHEIAQFQMSRYGTVNHDGLSSDDNMAQYENSDLLELPGSGSTQSSDNGESFEEPPPPPPPPLDPNAVVKPLPEQPAVRNSLPELPPASESFPQRPSPMERPLPFISTHEAQQGYLVNRGSLPSLSQVLNSLTHPVNAPSCSTQTLKKSTSHIRLSMTAEGNAKVVTKDSSSPSPPRPVPQAPDTLVATQARRNSLKRSASGRSRDSRAWEFWCDKESRSELEEKAEKDKRGSAADAIGMIRAANSRRALQPVTSKQNAAVLRQRGLKYTTGEYNRPSLQRARTSAGRLQGVHDPMARKRHRVDKCDSSISVYIPGNESDKENWSPGIEHLPHDQSKSKLPTASQSKPSGRNGMTNDENARAEDDPEIAAFMKSRSSRRRAPVDEELDCVQGLLSLSQGNWAT